MHSTTAVVLAILIVTLTTVLTRTGMLLAGERIKLSDGIEAALRFAPACALTALVLPEIVAPGGMLDVSLGNSRWPAALIAAVYLAWRRDVLGGIGLGVAAYVMLRSI
jgi:branched-subunit amino acid transport protein